MEFKEQKRYSFFSSQVIGRILLFAIPVFLSGAMQSSFFAASGFFKATPDLLLISVIGIAIFDGERSGAIAGIGAGVLAEAFVSGAYMMFFPLFYMLCGYFFGVVSRVFLNRNFVSWLLYMFIGAGLRGLLSVIHSMFLETDINLFLIFTEIVIPEYFLTLICSVPMYFLLRMTVRPFRKKIEME
jgi:cell shape-determining protein MreD